MIWLTAASWTRKSASSAYMDSSASIPPYLQIQYPIPNVRLELSNEDNPSPCVCRSSSKLFRFRHSGGCAEVLERRTAIDRLVLPFTRVSIYCQVVLSPWCQTHYWIF
jgi:hypothetical protein